ncbi:MAG: hypothetical protein R3D69_10815 [Xanthobacteraceae bacterium]
MERIQKHLGIKLVHVPFKGAQEVNIAVAGGHIMVGASGTSANPRRRRQAALPQHLDTGTAEDAPRRSDLARARISVRCRRADRPGGAEEHGPEGRRDAA